MSFRILLVMLSFLAACTSVHAGPVRHYAFFGQDREKLPAMKAFLDDPDFEGAQVTYTWKQLEPDFGLYDFGDVDADLALLASHGKRLFIQLQDVTFSPKRVCIPQYLRTRPEFHGGAEQQYVIDRDDEKTARPEGWVARRWDPAVQTRFHALCKVLGERYDGRIAGINLPETAVEFGSTGKLFPAGFTPTRYCDAIVANMRALRACFRKSVVMQYANFMPGEWLPDSDRGYLKRVYAAAQESGISIGAPDLLPLRKAQRDHAYPLIASLSAFLPNGIAVQDGNYDDVDKASGKKITVGELYRFAADTLHVTYVFWCIEEPYFLRDVIPFLESMRR